MFNTFFFDLPPAHWRIALNTAAMAMVTIGMAREFLRSDMDVIHRWAGGGLSLFVSAYLAVRVIQFATSPEITAPLAGGFPAAWAFVAMVVWTMPTRW